MNYHTQEEYFRVRAYIDEDALRHNIRVVREKIGPDVLLMGVVKADAYGHSARLVVPILEEEGADYLATATLEEAIQLRKQAVRLPILVLGYTDASQFQDAIKYQIHVCLYREEQAAALSAAAMRTGKTGLAHIKLETGMQRIGFPCCDESVAAIKRIAQLPGLALDGVFTHFARADERDKAQAEKQQALFDQFLDRLEKEGVTIPIHHTANSAAIMEYAASHKQHINENHGKVQWMARAGIMLYGLYPSEEMDENQTDLKPVLSLVSHVVHLKEVEEGTPIGYGGSYITKNRCRIATIPVGYGDGYPRRLSNIGYVRIHGEKAPIVGRVCMDQLMVDVTHIPQIQLGDEVVLIGKGVSAAELAQLTDTIHYELTCQLTGRVPRVLTGKMSQPKDHSDD